MGRAEGRVKEFFPTSWKNFFFFNDQVNKANIDRSKRKRKQKGQSHRTHPSKAEIFRLLLRNEINKTDIDRVKRGFHIALAKGTCFWSPNIKGPQTSLLYLSQFRKFFNLKCLILQRDYKEKPDQQSVGQQLGWLIKLLLHTAPPAHCGTKTHW